MGNPDLGPHFPNQLNGWVQVADGSWSLFAPDGTLVIAQRGGFAEVSEPHSDFQIANKKYGDENWGGGSQAIKAVTLPIAFNTPDLVVSPGITFYEPAIGDASLMFAVSVDTPWNGTTPTAHIYVNGYDVLQGINQDLTIADLVLGGSMQIFGAQQQFDVLKFIATHPMIVVVDDGAGGDPGSTQGSGTFVLLVMPGALA